MIVTVIKICSGLPDDEFIFVIAARLDRGLSDLSRTVHLVRHDQSMPMDRRGLGQVVMEINPNVVALGKLQPRSWYLMIVGIGLDGNVGENIPSDYRCFEVEYFYAVFESRLKWPIASCISRSLKCHLARWYRRHVPHRFGGCVERHNHAWGHY